jgi:hypothetical protein
MSLAINRMTAPAHVWSRCTRYFCIAIIDVIKIYGKSPLGGDTNGTFLALTSSVKRKQLKTPHDTPS